MTVPTNFRRSGPTPEGLELHYADLPGSDIEIRKGYRLTTPLRTILDLSETEWMPRAEVSAALMEMANRRLITRYQIQSANIPEATRQQFEKLLAWKKR
jgi:hypothetical protein